ncbi:hypothetical protein M404DRAFT_536304 [Pisolithus tinctorius Marx 270]|uniref:Uncharacterized protein n=1 Tax=Pisolithus tinctorius Marx 270 TaxID=870435 RepID=A0A0C3I7W8_PISTI|nr:hypothetical protein M404DRAFT_536304 [Pisolithus tinctorius Marx 270]
MWFPLQPHSTTCYIVGTRDDLTKHCTHHRFLPSFCSRASHVRSVPTITYDHDPCLPFRNSRLCLGSCVPQMRGYVALDTGGSLNRLSTRQSRFVLGQLGHHQSRPSFPLVSPALMVDGRNCRVQ